MTMTAHLYYKVCNFRPTDTPPLSQYPQDHYPLHLPNYNISTVTQCLQDTWHPHHSSHTLETHLLVSASHSSLSSNALHKRCKIQPLCVYRLVSHYAPLTFSYTLHQQIFLQLHSVNYSTPQSHSQHRVANHRLILLS